MSKEQWGHGFHNGYNKAKEEKQRTKKSQEFIGSWFHSFDDDGKVKWQGQIISSAPDGHYLVQLYNWFDGAPCEQKLVSFKDMLDWVFYPSDQEMRLGYYEMKNLSPQEITDSERIVLFLNGTPMKKINKLYPRH